MNEWLGTERRWLACKCDPATLKPWMREVVAKYNNGWVTVESWHENVFRDKWPNSETVGFVRETACDFPKEELLLCEPREKEETASATEVASPHFTAEQHEKYIDQRSEGVDGE